MSTITQNGGTIIISSSLNDTINYQGTDSSGTLTLFPITFINSSVNTLIIQFPTTLTLTQYNHYFIIGSSNITITGNNSGIPCMVNINLNLNNNGYNGLFGFPTGTSFTNIVIDYFGIVSSSYPKYSQGMLCQNNFSNANINYCYTTGLMCGNNCHMVNVTNSYSTCSSYSGGIFGSFCSNVTTKNCFITGINNIYNIFGYNTTAATVTSCYSSSLIGYINPIFASSTSCIINYCYGVGSIYPIVTDTYYQVNFLSDSSSSSFLWSDSSASSFLTDSNDWANTDTNTPWILSSLSNITPPTLLNTINNTFLNIGDNKTFTINVYGTGPFTYQWYLNEIAIPSTENSYTINSASAENVGSYYVEITGGALYNNITNSNSFYVTVSSVITSSGTVSMSENDIIFTDENGHVSLLFPVKINNNSNDLITITLKDITFSSVYNYFIIETDNITIGGSDGSISKVTIQNTPNYPGLIMINQYKDITIQYIGVLTNTTDVITTLVSQSGWICQNYQPSSVSVQTTNNIIQYCYSTGNMNNSAGIIGNSAYNITISNCYSTGDMIFSAGIIRIGAYNITISNCYSTGNIYYSSGILSSIRGDSTNIVTINNCYSTGNMNYSGGIYSANYKIDGTLNINNCFSTGTISYSGGIVAQSSNQIININNCYSIGNFTDTQSGSILGSSSNGDVTVTNCYGSGVITQKPSITSSTYYNYENNWADSSATILNQYTNTGNNTPWLLTNFLSNTPTSIYIQPTDQSGIIGNSVSFSVTAVGTQPFTYQWYFKEGLIEGATTNIYNITISNSNSGDYYVIVNNSISTIKSNIVTLSVFSAPVIVTDLVPVITNLNNTAYFYISVNANPFPTYKWYFKSSTSSSFQKIQNSNNFYIIYVSKDNVGSYYVTATNTYGTVTSTTVTLQIYQSPVITENPSNTTVTTGTTATFNVVASGTEPLSYMWYGNNNVIENEISNTYTTGVLDSTYNNYSYYVSIYNTNTSGIVQLINSTSAILTVTSGGLSPTINTQPTSVTIIIGNSATFKVIASGATEYQWYVNNSLIPNATSNTYTNTFYQQYSATYYVVVSNVYGSVTSNFATLTVNLPPPLITSISPNYGKVGTSVTIIGTYFTSDSTVNFGTVSSVVTFNSSTKLIATSPNSSGNIIVTNANGSSTIGPVNYFTNITQPDPPNIIKSSSGNKNATFNWSVSNNGGSQITSYTIFLNGIQTNPISGLTTTIGGLTNDTTYICTIYATNAAGNSNLATFSSVTPRSSPTITLIDPSYSNSTGGLITITGTNLYNPVINIGGKLATNITTTSTEVTATIPSSDINGKVTISINTDGGVVSKQNYFNYYQSPTIDSISPTSGSSVATNNVNISGRNLSSLTALLFNNISIGFNVISDYQISAIVPPYTDSPSSIFNITTPGGSAKSSQSFTYNLQPTLTSTNLTDPNTLIINGTSFISASTTINGSKGSTNTIDSTQLSVLNSPQYQVGDIITITTPGFTLNFPTLESISSDPYTGYSKVVPSGMGSN